MPHCIKILTNGNLRLDVSVVPPCPELTIYTEAEMQAFSGTGTGTGTALDIIPWELMLTTIDVDTVEVISGYSFMGLAIGLGGGWLYKAIRSGW